MMKNETETQVISAAGTHEITTDQLGSPSIAARLTARIQVRQLDRMLAVGAPARKGSALAVHAARLTSHAERELIASSLRRAVRDAITPVPSPFSARVPLNSANIVDARDVIDDITLRLHAPRPVSACGVARLRQLLADGSGPLYRHGRGDLKGRLGAALAVL